MLVFTMFLIINTDLLSFPISLQAPLVADVREVQLMLEPLMSYHPFWLRVGLTTVLRDALVNGQGVVSGRAAEERSLRRGLQAVVRESLLLEREVQAASNKQEFWVRGVS